jgi:exonuclease SbcC
MKFDRLRAKGFGPFKDEIDVDLASIDGKIIAVTGANGAGKSTLIELLAASIYRNCPTRGSLAELATARDAFLEVSVVNGASHRVRHIVDAVSKKGEAIVTDAEGRSLVASAKVRDYDAWAAKHFPPAEVFYASTFAAQGSGGFLDLKPGERKGVLLRALGIERLEALAEKAREHARATKGEITVLEARIADERSRASDPVKVSSELETLGSRRSELEISLTRARAALADVLAKEQAAKAAIRAAEDVRRRRSELEARLNDARTKRDDLSRRIGNNEGLIAQASEIRSAQEAALRLDLELAELVSDEREARSAEAAARRDRAAQRDALADVNNRAMRAADRRRRAESRLADKSAVEAAVASLSDLRAAVVSAESVVKLLETAFKRTADVTLTSTSSRIDNLRAPLTAIADGADNAATIAMEALAADDKAAREVVEASERMIREQSDLDRARACLASTQRDLASAERTAARAKEIEAAELELTEAQAEVTRLLDEATAAQAAFKAAKRSLVVAAESATKVMSQRDALQAKRTQLDPLVKLADRLTQAETRISELLPQSASIAADIEALERELASTPMPSDPDPLPDVISVRDIADVLDHELRGVEAAIAVREAQLSDARSAEARLRDLETERRRVDQELADWTRLADDLGRDGLQAMEIDAAGPELTELVNDLLRTCVGSRWTVTIEASRQSSDGKRQLEGCEVRVLDTERGREGTAETLSGGERVIVGEAVSLALSMLACRRSGVQGATLVRDESGAALDPANAPAYVAMLRRASTIVGASHVLFVSHSPEIQDLADARIVVQGGKVQVAA